MSAFAPTSPSGFNARPLRRQVQKPRAYEYTLVARRVGRVSAAWRVISSVSSVGSGTDGSGADATLMTQLKHDFATVKHVKPASSRKDSSERYVLAMGFRGVPNNRPDA